jgi:NAD(P)H-hydrate epimerase
VIPIVTPDEMAAIDRAAPEPVDVLIGRAGAAVARAALDLLGGGYGRRVVVLAGKGNNGNDGREAARRLRARGVAVEVLDAARGPEAIGRCDLVVDAAYGTGLRGGYRAPAVEPDQVVLAVDIPSGVSGLDGSVPSGADGRVLRADRTVTFAALKPGLVLQPGAARCGVVEVADIGLDVSSATAWLVEADDVRAWLPERDPSTHKWKHAVWVVAGSPGMDGAAALVCGGAQRAGAGYVRLSTPGGLDAPHVPVEVVRTPLPAAGWAGAVLDDLDRFAAVVVGNGLGVGDEVGAQVRRLVGGCAGRGSGGSGGSGRAGGAGGSGDVGGSGHRPTVVVDADGLTALGPASGPVDRAGHAVRVDGDGLAPNVVLTPHDGEFERLSGARPGADRLAAARDLAARLGCVVLLKGGPTVVAAPDGQALVVATGDARLATAGTGDVLAGVIGGLAAAGLDPLRAAAAGAFIHGRAGDLGWRHGLVAGDLPALLPAVLDRLGAASPRSAGPDH